MGLLLRKEDIIPDLIITSSAERALTTVEAVADACGYGEEIQVERSFYHGSTSLFCEVLSELPETYFRVLIVGHNPGLENFLEDLIGQWERLPTAALASLSLPLKSWADFDEDVEGYLEDLWLPREL